MRQPITRQKIAENYMKMKEIGGDTGPYRTPLDPPMLPQCQMFVSCFIMNEIYNVKDIKIQRLVDRC